MKISWRILFLRQLSQISDSYWDLCLNSKFRGCFWEGLLKDGPNNNKKNLHHWKITVWRCYWGFRTIKILLVWMTWNGFLTIEKVKMNMEYLLVICKSKKWSFHSNSFSKFAFMLKYKLLQVYYEAQSWPFLYKN